MLWCQGAHNIGLFNRKLKSAYPNTMLTILTDVQTDENCGNSATIASRAKKCVKRRNIIKVVL